MDCVEQEIYWDLIQRNHEESARNAAKVLDRLNRVQWIGIVGIGLFVRKMDPLRVCATSQKI